MSKTKTFVDASVLIAAFRGKDDICQKAMEVIEDNDREFVVSDYLKLELIPKPTFFKNEEELLFMQGFIDNASTYVHANSLITEQAIALACRYGLSAIDALHAEAAIETSADVLVTVEKPNKPFYRIKEIKIVSI
jgi:predicted nucleic acid-binding protein